MGVTAEVLLVVTTTGLPPPLVLLATICIGLIVPTVGPVVGGEAVTGTVQLFMVNDEGKLAVSITIDSLGVDVWVTIWDDEFDMDIFDMFVLVDVLILLLL